MKVHCNCGKSTVEYFQRFAENLMPVVSKLLSKPFFPKFLVQKSEEMYIFIDC